MAIIARETSEPRTAVNGTASDGAPRCMVARLIADWLEALLIDPLASQPCTAELRALGVTRHNSKATHNEVSHYLCDEAGLQVMAADARELSRRCEAVYFTLNPLPAGHTTTASDRDIVARRWLLIDCDPVRMVDGKPVSSIASNKDEQQAALEMATRVKVWLSNQGWPDPILASSGNGYHLLYRVNLPNDEQSTVLVKKVLATLAKQFDTESVTIDRSVYNASRICRLYGTVSRKGQPTKDRPHRVSQITMLPQTVKVVTAEQLAALIGVEPIEEAKPKPKPKRKGIWARDLGDDPVTAFGEAALIEEIGNVATEIDGHRNDTLFKSACKLFELAKAGSLDYHRVESELTTAARTCGLPDRDIQTTLRSADKRVGPRDLSHVGQKGKDKPTVTTIDPETGLKQKPADPHRLARVFLSAIGGSPEDMHLRYWDEQWWTWDGLKWLTLSTKEMHARITRVVKVEFDRIASETGKAPLPIGTGLIGNVAAALAGYCLVQKDQIPAQPAWLDGAKTPKPLECLTTTTGIVHLPTLLDNGPDDPHAVMPLTPRFFSQVALDYGFHPEAPTPTNWLAFLDSIWPDDRESIECLQEWFGLLLTSETQYQKILLILGPKRSGKGTMTRILKAMVGHANVAAPTLGSLATHFGLQSLIGKTLAMTTDIRLSGRSDSQQIVERLLSISGEDPQSIDRKHIDAWHGTLNVRFCLAGAELPRLGDVSGGLTGRMVVLVLKKSWLGEEDLDLQKKLLAELPGILLWAIAGYQRLRERRRFLQPASGAEVLREFDELSNPVGAFLADKCDCGPNHRVLTSDLYDAWTTWCKDMGREHPGDSGGFGRSLRAALPTLQVIRTKLDGKRYRHYQGVALKDDFMVED